LKAQRGVPDFFANFGWWVLGGCKEGGLLFSFFIE